MYIYDDEADRVGDAVSAVCVMRMGVAVAYLPLLLRLTLPLFVNCGLFTPSPLSNMSFGGGERGR